MHSTSKALQSPRFDAISCWYTKAMHYVHVSSPDAAIDHIIASLLGPLQSGRRVVWLLSGGSAIPLEVAAARQLPPEVTPTLTTLLIDERYDELGHEAENYTQLINAGFPLPINRVLTGKPIDRTTADFAATVQHALQTADVSIGVFGIGADGHTAGIKPHSPAVSATELAAHYAWDDFERITVTPLLIRSLDEAIIYAVGAEKADTLQQLFHEDAPIGDQPAQVLKAVKTSTLYTDISL